MRGTAILQGVVGAAEGRLVGEHRIASIDFRRPSSFVAICICGWRSEPTISAGVAGAMLDAHAFEAQAGVLTVAMTQVAAAGELYATVVPRLKDLVRTSRTDLILEPLVRMAALAELVGEEEAAFAVAVGRKAFMLDGTASTRDRANVIAGLVELGERSRQVLEHHLPQAPRRLRCQ